MKNSEVPNTNIVQLNAQTYDISTQGNKNNMSHVSLEKMKNMMIGTIIKKSPSSTYHQLSHPLAAMKPITQKSITHDKKAKKLQDSSKVSQKSPQKPGYLEKIGEVSQFQHLDIEEKRRRIYGMPYLVDKFDTGFETASYPQQYLRTYSETISTECSQKEKSGLKISDFEMGKMSGAGKFGQVYMARHRKSGFVCALKQIKKEGLDEMLETQLIREIKIQMFLNHPNIVKLYTFFHDEDHIYLVLEPCCSGQLYNFLKKHQPVREQLAKVIIRQICQGLDYLHENYIIHRDLKPENILYHNSMMKICDFGWSIATPLMRETFCGTPLYISPELLKKNSYNNKVDIWSLGILAFEILVGHVPFEIFSEADYIKIIKNDVRFPRFIQISEQARDFIRWCLQKDPEMRPTSSELLQHPFIKKTQLINFSEID